MVLLVDDNDFNLITLKEVLHQSFKLRCDLATNGKDCLQKCHIRSANPYRLIFMDCMMPVMDGFEATQAIRMILPKEVCTIVALSAMTH